MTDGIKDFSLKGNTANPGGKSRLELIIKQLPDLTEGELAELRYSVDALLPLDLGSLDLAEELALQFQQAKALLVDVQRASDIPANQKAQIFNSVRGQLESIVKNQEVVWSMERLKKFEVALVKACGLLTDEAKAAFFDLYSQFLKDPEADLVKVMNVTPGAAAAGAVTAPRMLRADAREMPQPEEAPAGTGGPLATPQRAPDQLPGAAQ